METLARDPFFNLVQYFQTFYHENHKDLEFAKNVYKLNPTEELKLKIENENEKFNDRIAR